MGQYCRMAAYMIDFGTQTQNLSRAKTEMLL